MGLKKKPKHHEEEGGEAWLLPYSDLMTLLLAVFIVLFAVSQVDETKAAEMAHEFQKTLTSAPGGIMEQEGDTMIPSIYEEQGGDIFNGESMNGSSSQESTQDNTESSTEDNGQEGTAVSDNQTTSENQSTSDNQTEQPPVDTTQMGSEITQEELEAFLGQNEMSDLEQLKEQLDAVFAESNMSASVSTHIDTRGLVITLNNAILFDSGSADIKDSNTEALLHIAKIVNTLDNYIRIEGHTDNVPIQSSAYPSNWELSTARASRVVRLFVDEGNVAPDKVMAVGYGEFKPIADNSTPEGREKNRRIDIIILSEKYSSLEKVITVQE